MKGDVLKNISFGAHVRSIKGQGGDGNDMLNSQGCHNICVRDLEMNKHNILM